MALQARSYLAGIWASSSQAARVLRATAIAVAMLHPVSSVAQSVPLPAAGSKPVVTASVSHAAAKGITLKIGSVLKKLVIFSTGTGSVAAGGMLTAITATSGYAIYVANEYLWDSYAPQTSLAADHPFDTSASFWRNTEKYLTLKPVGMAATWSLVYLYTGSWTATLAMGSASSLAGPLLYYANNIGWDWYDWYSGSAEATKASPASDQQPPPPTAFSDTSRTLAFGK